LELTAKHMREPCVQRCLCKRRFNSRRWPKLLKGFVKEADVIEHHAMGKSMRNYERDFYFRAAAAFRAIRPNP